MVTLEETKPRTVTTVVEETEIREELGRLWRVICHDDPYTTMEFVVEVFIGVFRLPAPRAFEVMLRVHNQGSALVGLWPRTVAERKVQRVHSLARASGFPLTLTLEEDD